MKYITMVRRRPPALMRIRFYSPGTTTGPTANSKEANEKAWGDPRVRELRNEFADLRENYSNRPCTCRVRNRWRLTKVVHRGAEESGCFGV